MSIKDFRETLAAAQMEKRRVKKHLKQVNLPSSSSLRFGLKTGSTIAILRCYCHYCHCQAINYVEAACVRKSNKH